MTTGPARAVALVAVLLSFPYAAETVAVTNLTSSGVGGGEAYSLTSSFRSELGKTGAFEVMERSQMEEILKEQGFQQTGACDEATCAIEMGQILAVRYMTLGHVGKVGKTYTLSIRLVSVATGKIAKDITEYHKGSVDGLLTETIPVIVRKLAGTYQEEEPKDRRGLVVGLSTAAVAAAVAIPIIISVTGDDEQEPAPSTTDVIFKWNE